MFMLIRENLDLHMLISLQMSYLLHDLLTMMMETLDINSFKINYDVLFNMGIVGVLSHHIIQIFNGETMLSKQSPYFFFFLG